LSELRQHSDLAAVTPEDERWALVRRVASSRQLGKASQLREILLYICRRALDEGAGSVTEQEIGCKVLGRRPDFNPNEDNIVRAQVRHLRQKLEDYFALEGAEEPLILTIPKGGYIPHFEARPAPEAAAKGSRRPSRAMLLGVAAAGVIVMAALIAIWQRQQAQRHGLSASEATQRANDPLWQKIFVPGRETSIVMSDTCMVMLQDILDVDVSLTDYLSGGYPEKLMGTVADPKLRAALKLIAARQYTSLGDATTATRLMELSHRYAAHTVIRYSRHISVREFKAENFILIGSRRGVPWVQLFEPRLNFAMEEDRQTRRYHFRNRSPISGEEAVYGPASAGADAVTYADIALLPNLAATGHVLLLMGIDMAGTEAAGELVAGADFPATVSRLLASRTGKSPASAVEILIQAKAVGGTTGDAKVVAYRLLD